MKTTKKRNPRNKPSRADSLKSGVHLSPRALEVAGEDGKDHSASDRRQRGDWSPVLLPAVRGLVCVAMAISAYLAWLSLIHGKVAGCGPESGCDAVLKSRWAYWFGVPVSLPALAVYAGVLGVSFRLDEKLGPNPCRRRWQILIALACMILGAAAWFVLVQLALIHRVCPFCMAAHGCGAAAALVLGGGPIRRPSQISGQREKQVYVAPAVARKLALLAGVGVTCLMAGQCLQPFRAFEVKNLARGDSPAPTPDRFFSLYGDAFRFNLRELPLLGSPAASNVMVSLFDYTCPHCREVHPLLQQAERLFRDRLAILSLPMPLDTNCNWILRYQNPKHRGGCEYAKLGLAVWRADRSKHQEFDDWLFTNQPLPALDQARWRAAGLVGSNALLAALADSWITNLLAHNIALYDTNHSRLNVGAMPELMIGSNVISGQVQFPDLLRSLGLQFGLATNSLP